MSVTFPVPDQESESEAPAGVWSVLLRRYAVHLGLLLTAGLVLLASRVSPFWDDWSPRFPTLNAGIVVATPTPEPVVAEVVAVVAEPTVIAETAVQRVALPHTFEPDLPSHDFAKHVVVSGDTPNGVAEEYGLEPATLLWANPGLSDESQLFNVGITLTILPTNGVLHVVEISDTVDLLAETYGVDPAEIIDYEDNHIQDWPHRLVPGTEIFVPGGEKPFLVWSYTPNSVRGQVGSSTYYDGPVVAGGIGRFGWPTDSWRLTQYYWWAHPAIDIGTPIGMPIYASDSGTVIVSGWSSVGYGNHVVIDHGNGFVTLYAHMSQLYVAAGQFVVGGSTIGAAGSTGNSSGPHLHFEIRYNGNMLNPLDYLWQ